MRAMKAGKLNPIFAVYIAGLVALAASGYFCASLTARPAQAPKLETAQAAQPAVPSVAYVNLPTLDVMLPSFKGRAMGRVRMDITIAVDKKYEVQLKDLTPRITSRLTDYAREIDIDEAMGPHATQHLRQNLLQEATMASNPVPLIDVIFRQFVIL